MVPGTVFLVLYAAALFASRRASGRFWTSEISPGNDPPWYFIGQDLIYGLFCLAALAVTLTIALRTRRRTGNEGWMAAWMAMIWLGYPAVQALYVLALTSRIYVLFVLALAGAAIFGAWSRRLFTPFPSAPSLGLG